MDTIIMLQGDKLAAALKTIMELNDNDTLKENSISHREEVEEENKNGGVIENDAVDHEFVKDLCKHSKALEQLTPTSVLKHCGMQKMRQ
eukprot:13308130-Ditylum_brightwellii.AAC.1